MQQEYLDFLHDTLKYLGFGVDTPLNLELESKIKQDLPAFELQTDTCFDGESLMSARLFFKQGIDAYKDRYFFNRYEARLHYLATPDRDRKHTFYIEHNRRGVTFKQAYNLLQGRYVQKRVIDQNNEPHFWWVHLEPGMGQDGGAYLRSIKRYFDLEKALDLYPIQEVKYPDGRERICSALRRGNLHPVTFMHENKKTEMKLLYANPDKGVICNVAMATGATEPAADALSVNQSTELEAGGDEPISESLLQREGQRDAQREGDREKELSRVRKKAQL